MQAFSLSYMVIRYILLLSALFFIFVTPVYAQRGCCSHHGGISYCGSNGYFICADGMQSPSCECSYAPPVQYNYYTPEDAYSDTAADKSDAGDSASDNYYNSGTTNANYGEEKSSYQARNISDGELILILIFVLFIPIVAIITSILGMVFCIISFILNIIKALYDWIIKGFTRV